MAKTKAIQAPAQPPPQQTLTRSVEEPPISLFQGPGGGDSFVMWMATIADIFTPWGTGVARRDIELRDWWHTESLLASAVYTVTAANAGFKWKLTGPPATTEAVQEVLNMAGGKGWRTFIQKISTDLYTQDNGAFFEIIRAGNSPSAAILGIRHLEAGRCLRTGDLETPVIYTNTKGVMHKMPWYTVVTLEEFPSPIETMFNVQYCAVTRVLRMAQIMRDIAMYRGEKVGGRFTEAIHIVGGVKQSDIDDVRERAQNTADNQGVVRYLTPLIVASLDPQTAPSVATLDMKALPEAFDLDEEFRWYIAQIALGFGRDYQEFAPLPRGNLGSGSQSEILHLKSRGKGPATFMEMIEHAMNAFVMPRTVTFEYAEQDIEAEKSQAEVEKSRAEGRAVRISSGEIDPIIARQIAQDEGDLDGRFLELLGESDLTPDMMITQTEKPEENSDTVLAEKLVSKAWENGSMRPLSEIFAEQKWVQSVDGKMQQLQDVLVQLIDDKKVRQDQAREVVANMELALQELKDTKKEPIDVEEIVHRAVFLANIMGKDKSKSDELLSQEVLQRDNEGRALVLRKTFASGKVADYRVTGRDADQRMKKIEKIN